MSKTLVFVDTRGHSVSKTVLATWPVEIHPDHRLSYLYYEYLRYADFPNLPKEKHKWIASWGTAQAELELSPGDISTYVEIKVVGPVIADVRTLIDYLENKIGIAPTDVSPRLLLPEIAGAWNRFKFLVSLVYRYIRTGDTKGVKLV